MPTMRRVESTTPAQRPAPANASAAARTCPAGGARSIRPARFPRRCFSDTLTSRAHQSTAYKRAPTERLDEATACPSNASGFLGNRRRRALRRHNSRSLDRLSDRPTASGDPRPDASRAAARLAGSPCFFSDAGERGRRGVVRRGRVPARPPFEFPGRAWVLVRCPWGSPSTPGESRPPRVTVSAENAS